MSDLGIDLQTTKVNSKLVSYTAICTCVIYVSTYKNMYFQSYTCTCNYVTWLLCMINSERFLNTEHALSEISKLNVTLMCSQLNRLIGFAQDELVEYERLYSDVFNRCVLYILYLISP